MLAIINKNLIWCVCMEVQKKLSVASECVCVYVKDMWFLRTETDKINQHLRCTLRVVTPPSFPSLSAAPKK